MVMQTRAAKRAEIERSEVHEGDLIDISDKPVTEKQDELQGSDLIDFSKHRSDDNVVNDHNEVPNETRLHIENDHEWIELQDPKDVSTVLKDFHDNPLGGHQGA